MPNKHSPSPYLTSTHFSHKKKTLCIYSGISMWKKECGILLGQKMWKECIIVAGFKFIYGTKLFKAFLSCMTV